jgi:molecular chaperone HscB
MTSDLSTPAVQICRNCGGAAPIDAHFCPHCSRVLGLGPGVDYFSFLGVPRKLNLDTEDLERRFRTLSRQFHPDYFYNAAPAERRASLERASYLNDAFRTLRQPGARTAYLLDLEGAGLKVAGQGTPQVPPSLLEEVFALNEELDAVRDMRASGVEADQWKARLERAREPIEAKRVEHEAELAELSAAWDATVDDEGRQNERQKILGALRDRMLERNYIANLLGGIEKELQ